MPLKTSLLLLAAVIIALAGSKPAPKIPTIPDAQRAAFWRATLEKTSADARYSKALEAMQQSCSSGGAMLSLGPDGEPVCAPKPPEPKKH